MRTASDQTDIFYSVQRVNLEMGIINITSTDLQPVPAQGNVVSVGSAADQINKSKQLFASTVKDNLYLGAYREVLGGAIKQVAPNGLLNELVPPSHTAWKQTLTNLGEYCSRLSAMAGTQIDCLSNGLRQWGGLQAKSATNL
ncbi:hypothetical protein [Crenobacter cavernae]|uniref:Uncharacterized protein n=1 Tax=Crenobacter cavernae TaxID=2290923 RepID=A0A345Y5B3_9NEIS|nr:hypothetical protein [Crenobacter cavernae]AXK39115.1 hypothetical protein DWG20_06540 [Crenobacter cavernae]